MANMNNQDMQMQKMMEQHIMKQMMEQRMKQMVHMEPERPRRDCCDDGPKPCFFQGRPMCKQYCSPAPFGGGCGSHHKLLQAYGIARACDRT